MGCHDISMVLTSLRLGKPGFWWPRLTHLTPWIQSTTTWPHFPKSKITCEMWFWGWELERIIMMFFSSCCWKKIHCNLKSDQNRKQRFRDLAETVKPVAGLNFHWGIWLVRCIFSLTGEDINFKQIQTENSPNLLRLDMGRVVWHKQQAALLTSSPLLWDV